jgi:Flp pilus assembly protein TadB
VDVAHGQRGEAVAMSITVSAIIAALGCFLLLISSRWGAGQSNFVAAALLSDGEEPTIKPAESPFQENLILAAQKRRKCWIIGAFVVALLRAVFFGFSPIGIVVAGGIGGLAGELFFSRRRENRKAYRLRQMEFYLPTAMERIVMGVGSGLDIVPALLEASRKGVDPISQLLNWVVKLSESGIPVETAFELASKEAACPSVKHAFIHLSLAYKQGGEIVRPLKELSDATQLAYQETIEEQIAKLPVKAVLPLVLTFTGLIVCFLTVPLMQLGSITDKALDVAQE